MGHVPSMKTATFEVRDHKYRVGDPFDTPHLHGKVEHVTGDLVRVRIWEYKE